MPRVKITLNDGFDRNLVEVDGHDMTSVVTAVQFTRTADRPLAEVVLHLRADQVYADIDAEVVAVLPPQPQPSAGAALDALLAGVDPGELEQAALARMGGMDGGATSTAEAFVAVLRDWAKED